MRTARPTSRASTTRLRRNRNDRSERTANTPPGRDGRAGGAPLPGGAAVQPDPRRRIQGAPRGLRNGDAPVRRAYQGSGEDEAVPGGLSGPTRDPAATGARQEGTLDHRGGKRLR